MRLPSDCFEIIGKRIPGQSARVRLAAAALLLSFGHVSTHLHGSYHTSLRSYTATHLPNYTATSYTATELHGYQLHGYRATRKASSRHPARQRGARNGTPRESCLLLSFLSLSLFRRSALRRQLLISSHNGGRSSYSEAKAVTDAAAVSGHSIKAPSPRPELRPVLPHTRWGRVG